MTFLEQSEVQRIGDAIGLKGRFLVDWGIDDIINTLCPIPQTEAAEIMRWAVIDADGDFKCSLDHDLSEHQMKSTWPGCQCVPFTIPYERPVKPKVKRREEAGTFYSGYDADRREGNKNIPDDAKLFFEWEE